jgi:predicted nucleic acid-binding protein
VNVVDSSAWLEYFSDSPRAKHFADPIEQTDQLIVPVTTLYEVFKKLRREVDEDAAFQAVAYIRQGKVIEVDESLALEAATLDLPMADSLILATARKYQATLWTQDTDFEGMPGVKYFPKV